MRDLKGNMETTKETKAGNRTMLPWVAHGDQIRTAGAGWNSARVADCRAQHDEGEANAEFIVRAVNAHGALVAALTDLLDTVLPDRCNVRPHEDCGCYSCRTYDTIEAAQAALALAQGGAK